MYSLRSSAREIGKSGDIIWKTINYIQVFPPRSHHSANVLKGWPELRKDFEDPQIICYLWKKKNLLCLYFNITVE